MLMSQTYLTHESLMEKLNRDQELERQELEAQKKSLSLEIEQMVKSHKENRERVENETWEQIESIKEKNKQELAMEVDKGMKQRTELILIKNKYRKEEMERETHRNTINEQQAMLSAEIANTNREK